MFVFFMTLTGLTAAGVMAYWIYHYYKWLNNDKL